MKRLYTYTDFIQKTTNENVNHFDESNRDFVLNEMQPSWTPEETKSMYEITKENIYQKLKDKFFQRIDIILTGDEDLFSSSKSGGFGSYYDSEMAKKIDGKSTYKEISDKIKKVWNDKILSRLNFTSDLQSGYDTLKNSKRNDLFSDGHKNSYDIVNGAYNSTTWGKSTEGMKVLDTLLWKESPFYKTKTDSIFSESGINSDTEYRGILNHLKTVEWNGEHLLKDLDAKLKFEFFEYYRHYHFWLFANLIMSGKPQSTASTTAPSSKTKSSSGSTTSTTSSPKRERLNVDRNAVGERFSGL
jgi:hypothetical protein